MTKESLLFEVAIRVMALSHDLYCGDIVYVEIPVRDEQLTLSIQCRIQCIVFV